MPYKVEKTDRCPVSKPWGVIKETDGQLMGCHSTKEKANKQVAAIEANTDEGSHVSTSTLTPEQRRNVHFLACGDGNTGLFAGAPKPKFEFKKNDAGANVLHMSQVPVFRSGTFRDSVGMQHNWEEIHLKQMVSYWELLRDQHVFEDVPVRSGHRGWLVSGTEGTGKVVGWHTGLEVVKHTSTHDGKEYSFLVAEYDILDPDAQQAVQSGLWRNRSSEVGSYVTNDETEYWPVYQGVAYVDIPAVEGLNSFSSPHFSVIPEKEFTVSGSTAHPGGNPPVLPPVLPPAPGTPAQHGAPAPAPFAFRIGGAECTDFNAVQQHINSLETVVKENKEESRKNFVSQLASDNKILASQVEGLTAHALSLDDKQWESWSGLYKDSPVVPLLQQHGQTAADAGDGQPSANPAGDTKSEADKAKEYRVATLRDMVLQHKRGGMKLDKLKEKASYKELISLDPSFTL